MITCKNPECGREVMRARHDGTPADYCSKSCANRAHHIAKGHTPAALERRRQNSRNYLDRMTPERRAEVRRKDAERKRLKRAEWTETERAKERERKRAERQPKVLRDATGRKMPTVHTKKTVPGAPPPVFSPRATPHKREASSLTDGLIRVIRAEYERADEIRRAELKARNPDIFC